MSIRPLNSNLKSIACEELNEEPEKIQENLDLIREWIKKSQHLKARTDDQFLVIFLRGCKYSLECTKKKIEIYYTLHSQLRELMIDLDPMDSKSQDIIKLGLTLPLPLLEKPDSPRIMLMRLGAFDAHKYTILDVSKVITMVYSTLIMEDDNMIVSGLIIIVDLADVTLAHLSLMQPVIVKKILMMWQDGPPIRQKGVHYINAVDGFETIFNLVKGFLNEKLRSRLFIHSSMDSLYKVVPQNLMPSEYGGEAGSLESLTEVWENKIISNRQFYLDQSKYGVDESKRIGDPKNSSSLFGLDGSFRKLEFD